MVQSTLSGLGTLPLLIGGGTLLAVLVVIITILAARRARRRRPDSPVVVGRKAFCSLCDTHFPLPMEAKNWARCPKCSALVPI